MAAELSTGYRATDTHGWRGPWGKERHKRNSQSFFLSPRLHLCPGLNHLPPSARHRETEGVGEGWAINSASEKVNIKDRLNSYFHFKYRFIKENYEEWENVKRPHFLMCFKTGNEAEPSGRSWKEHYSTCSLSCEDEWIPYLFFINC